jgi:hypothetical protein
MAAVQVVCLATAAIITGAVIGKPPGWVVLGLGVVTILATFTSLF